jgi:transcriptional regulator with XRE-family HTH domain
MINLEKKIKRKLAEQKLTIEKLSLLAGFTKQTMHNIFNKNDIKLSQLYKVAKVLQTNVSYFFEEEMKKYRVEESQQEYSKKESPDLEHMKLENTSLKRENELLREMNEMLKSKN